MSASVIYVLVSFAISILTTCLAPVVAAVGAAVTSHRHRDRDRVEVWIRWWFVVAVAVGAGLVALSFLLAPVPMATLIGYSTANDFQREIAVANLGFAVIAVLSLRAGAQARFGFSIGYAVFLWGALLGHVWEAIAHGNHGSGNVGGILIYDLVVPLVAILLCVAERRRSHRPVTA